ncbi:MAG: DUF3137 domain-containing protein [Bdellovibrionales bacterium]|jgi:hypothetical protein|nr:DUF3137 domain-containing protein [Bdellovibrionales bacterium]
MTMRPSQTSEEILENLKKKHRRFFPNITIPGLTAASIGALALAILILHLFQSVVIAGFFVIIGLIWLFGRIWIATEVEELEYELRKSIFTSVVKRLRPGAKYQTGSRFQFKDLNSSRFFSSISNRATFKDEIIGSHLGVSWEIHHYTIFNRSIFDKNSDRRAENGLLVKAAASTKINGVVKIDLDMSGDLVREALSDAFHETIKSSGFQLIRLENPTFEKFFVVTAIDPIEARTVLNPKMMELFAALKSKLDTRFQCSILSNAVYFVFPGQKFNSEISSRLTLQTIERMFETEISTAEAIIETLKLNDPT